MEGNQMKMREALVAVQKKIEYLCGSFNVPNSLVARRMEINGIINAALSAPPRQCDVGTALEQKERFDAFCNAQPRKRNACDCALQKNRQGLCEGLCEFAWAQTPYSAEEGAGE